MTLVIAMLAAKGVCGTPQAIMEFMEKGPKARPTCQTSIATTHFRIHYDTTGTHAVTHEFADSVGVYAEHAWSVYVDHQGWYGPLPDGNNGGDSLYDMYIQYISGNVLGYTSPEGYGGPYPDGGYSYIVIGKGWDWFTTRNTVVHEFNHACQMTYEIGTSPYANIWFMENTAVWGQEMCYPDDNDYIGYLGGTGPLRRPNYEINHMKNPTDLYEYAGVCWTLFLTFWTEDTLSILNIWKRYGEHSGYHSLSDIDYVLYYNYGGKSLKQAFENYAIWRWFTNSHYDDYHWSEADLWPSVLGVKIHHSYPASGDEGIWAMKGPGGTDYVIFDSFSGYDTLYFYFDGKDGFDMSCFVIGYRSGPSNQSDTMRITLNSDNWGALPVPTAGYDTLVLVPVVTTWVDGGVTPDISFDYLVSTVDVSEDMVVGNEFSGQATPKGLLLQLPEASVVQVQLYDPAGRTVWSTDFQARAGSNQLELPELNSGVYFWRASYKNTSITGKTVR